MIELLKNLSLDRWYKMLLALSVALMLLSLTVQLHAISNATLLLISFGGFLFAMGEWVNHPTGQEIYSLPGGFATRKVTRRVWHPVATAVEIIGIAVALWGLCRAVFPS